MLAFKCPDCDGMVSVEAGALRCRACGGTTAIRDGIVDYAAGDAGSVIDHRLYDEPGAATSDRAATLLRGLRDALTTRWPDRLGDVLEVGCGTGALSEAWASRANTLLVSDANPDLVRATRDRLAASSAAERTAVQFATLNGEQDCFRQASFNTCIGVSVLHHMRDVRGFLGRLFRWLKPGGRAIFVEPNARFHRAFAFTLADILALLVYRDPDFSFDRQKLINIIAQARRVLLHQGDDGFLATLDDKHAFEAESFAAMARGVGYAKADAVPLPTAQALAHLRTVCDRVGVGEPTRTTVLELLPSYMPRYLAHLSERDRAASYVFWLEKAFGPVAATFSAPAVTEAMDHTDAGHGGLGIRFGLQLEVYPYGQGADMAISGWCLVNQDVGWLRVTLNGGSQQTPVWHPRSDVQKRVNGSGLFTAWNAFCCGIKDLLHYDGIDLAPGEAALQIHAVLSNGTLVEIPAPATIRWRTVMRLPA